MAFQADYPTPAGTLTAFYYLAAYTPFQMTGDIQLFLFIYPNKDARLAHKKVSDDCLAALRTEREKDAVYRSLAESHLEMQRNGLQVPGKEVAARICAEVEKAEASAEVERLKHELRKVNPQEKSGSTISVMLTDMRALFDQNGDVKKADLYAELAKRPDFRNYERID